MATEDHDLEEVSQINFFGKNIRWDTNQEGPVGRMHLEGIKSAILDLKLAIGSHKNSEKLISLFESAYLEHSNLSDATRYLINNLFGRYGIVIIDPDNKYLKKQFVSQMKTDILRNGFVDPIKKCSKDFSNHYKVQAFVRDTNFFKLSDNERVLVSGGISEEMIDGHPEMFSPNVLLRPLYQEVILPNIAYIGGSSEIAYWMQLRSAFKQEGIPFPILCLRNSALLINKIQLRRFERLGFDLNDLFLSKDTLVRKYVLMNSNSKISFDSEIINLEAIYNKLMLKSSDESFRQSVKAQLKKQISLLYKMEKKLIKIEKKRHQDSLNQIEKIKQQLFPDNVLQERSTNFIPYYLDSGDNFIKILKDNLLPLKPNFVVLTV